MATTTGTSSSCMGLISGSGNSSSCLTLATGKHLAGELQILPGLALVRRRAQQISRVVGHDQGHTRFAKDMNLLPQTAKRYVSAQQILGGYSPYHQHDFRFQ